jgi:hypothetical protein
MLHKNIKRFTVQGVVADDSYIIRTRETNERLIQQEMEDTGYAQVLDLGTFWSTLYYPQEDVYEFTLTAYGVFVGKRQACLAYGMIQGNMILKDTLETKHKQS